MYIYCVWSCNDSRPTVLYGVLESVFACYGAMKIIVIIIIIIIIINPRKNERGREKLRKK